MNILRFFKNKKWTPLYFSELKNRLRRDKNLSDINNIAEARQNLELTGEVDTHHHDNRYPLKDDVINEISTTKKILENSINDTNINIETIKNNIANQTSVINAKLDSSMIHVGSSTPTGVQGKIWFCTADNNISVKAFDNGKWITAGAIWQ